MAYTDYKLVRADVAEMDATVAALIADGWQPLGSPMLGLPFDNVVIQVMTKGGPSAGVVAVADISDATAFGKSLLQAADADAAKALLGII